MIDDDMTPWKKSSRSGGNDGACVEARWGGGVTQVRDSKDRPGPVLTFPAVAWVAFLDGVKEGKFDPID